MRWTVFGLLLALGFLGLGAFFLFTGEPLEGTMFVLLGAAFCCMTGVMYGQHRGDPRARGRLGPWYGPYLLLGELAMGLIAANGVLLVIFAPVGSRIYRDTPTESRIYGLVIAVLAVFAAIRLFVRSKRAGQPAQR